MVLVETISVTLPLLNRFCKGARPSWAGVGAKGNGRVSSAAGLSQCLQKYILTIVTRNNNIPSRATLGCQN